MVGGTRPPANDATRAAVLLVGSKGTSCTGVAIARDLVLTAAHCVHPGADYKLVGFDAARSPTLKDPTAVASHPDFDAPAARHHRVTPDVDRRGAISRYPYFRGLGLRDFRRTPAPPPFSSIKTTPAASIAVRSLIAVISRPPNLPSLDSRRAIVGSEMPDAFAKSPCDQPSKALAALI